jgi:hypothetical protein
MSLNCAADQELIGGNDNSGIVGHPPGSPIGGVGIGVQNRPQINPSM